MPGGSAASDWLEGLGLASAADAMGAARSERKTFIKAADESEKHRIIASGPLEVNG